MMSLHTWIDAPKSRVGPTCAIVHLPFGLGAVVAFCCDWSFVILCSGLFWDGFFFVFSRRIRCCGGSFDGHFFLFVWFFVWSLFLTWWSCSFSVDPNDPDDPPCEHPCEHLCHWRRKICFVSNCAGYLHPCNISRVSPTQVPPNTTHGICGKVLFLFSFLSRAPAPPLPLFLLSLSLFHALSLSLFSPVHPFATPVPQAAPSHWHWKIVPSHHV